MGVKGKMGKKITTFFGRGNLFQDNEGLWDPFKITVLSSTKLSLVVVSPSIAPCQVTEVVICLSPTLDVASQVACKLVLAWFPLNTSLFPNVTVSQLCGKPSPELVIWPISYHCVCNKNIYPSRPPWWRCEAWQCCPVMSPPAPPELRITGSSCLPRVTAPSVSGNLSVAEFPLVLSNHRQHCCLCISACASEAASMETGHTKGFL